MIFSNFYTDLAENPRLISLSVIYHHLQINPPGFVTENSCD